MKEKIKTPDKSKNSLQYQFKSFSFAFNGLIYFFTREQKATIHTALAFIAVLCGLFLKLSNSEWCFVIVAIVVVFVTEILNSAIENLVDMVQPNHSKQAGIIKDMAAGAVLFSSVGALITGILIYLPKLIFIFFHNL
jgi:diacylglycerol kinase